MAEDVEILRAVWHSSLPVVFRLADHEVTGLSAPEPFYAMVSRISYFPLIVERVIHHFRREERATDVWLDCEGTPLKWYSPHVNSSLTHVDSSPGITRSECSSTCWVTPTRCPGQSASTSSTSPNNS